MRRGDFVTAAISGDLGKPRPALIVQSDAFALLPSVMIVPATTDLRESVDRFRLLVQPTPENGLRLPSQLMIDKLSSIYASRVGGIIGHADRELLTAVAQAISEFLALA